MDPKGTIQAYVDAVNSQDWFRLDSLVATDFVRHSVAAGEPPVRSRADLVKFLRREYETFPDAQEIILDIFAEGEKVAVRHHFRGTQLGPLDGTCPPAEPWMPSTSQSIMFGTAESSRLGPNGTISLA